MSRYEGITRDLEPSKQERRMERELASNNKAPQSEFVSLTANWKAPDFTEDIVRSVVLEPPTAFVCRGGAPHAH